MTRGGDKDSKHGERRAARNGSQRSELLYDAFLTAKLYSAFPRCTALLTALLFFLEKSDPRSMCALSRLLGGVQANQIQRRANQSNSGADTEAWRRRGRLEHHTTLAHRLRETQRALCWSSHTREGLLGSNMQDYVTAPSGTC